VKRARPRRLSLARGIGANRLPAGVGCEEPPTHERAGDGDLEWYKDAVIYELRVRSFFDGRGDGVGDFVGLTGKLGYLQDLGVTALWLLPFYPSPLKDDGYDISDYTAVHPDVGTLDHFREFLQEAHSRGIRVITELVLNHTSDQHPWFQRARRAGKGDAARDFYIWSDSPTRYSEARVIFNDFEESNWTWDPIASAWFFHRFYAHQPDLNFDNPAVVEAMLRVIDFWLDMGVDGLRLDAIPYLYKREGTSCENLPETHELIRAIRRHIETSYPGRMLLAEANQWPEDAVAYFGSGDECQMAFHFPIMPRLFMALRMEDRFPIIDVLEQTPAIPDSCQWALFLRNHDEMTLEMVTDEERDYMWRTHAVDRRARINQGIRRRLAPLVGNSRRRLELLNSLLLSLPGTPVLYYGDEIGMGDNLHLGDRNGVRTPMQWNADRNAGFSSVDSQRLILPVVTDPEYHYQTINVETQQSNPSSLLWWTKRMLALRKQRRVFGRGTIRLLQPSNPRVLAFVRQLGSVAILVVANLSRFVQYVELDLSDYRGVKPRELIGGARFPPVRSKPYPLTIGPHGFYWIALSESARHTSKHRTQDSIPVSKLPVAWKDMGSERGRAWFARLLGPFLQRQRWATEAHAPVRRVCVEDSFDLRFEGKIAHMLVVAVELTEGLPVRYFVPLSLAMGPFADALLARFPDTVLARTSNGSRETTGLVHDAMADREFCVALLTLIENDQAHSPRLIPKQLASWSRMRGDIHSQLQPHLPTFELPWTAVDFADRLTLKLVRRMEAGVQPDEEVSAAVCGVSTAFPVPELGAVLRWKTDDSCAPTTTLALVETKTPSFGNAWRYTVGELARFFDGALGAGDVREVVEFSARSMLDAPAESMPAMVRTALGSFLITVELMAARLAEVHIGLASVTDDDAFRPEPFTALYQRSLYQGVRSATVRAFHQLAEVASPHTALQAGQILRHQRELLAMLRPLVSLRISACRTRIHGDMNLGHLLYSGRDFVVADLFGDPETPLTQRRMKRCALRDVAGMITSFHRAATTSLRGETGGAVRAEDRRMLQTWAGAWLRAVVASFLKAYGNGMRGRALVPEEQEQTRVLLFAYLLERQVLAIGRYIDDAGSEVEIALDMLGQLVQAAP
jgi:maltose alpha-D-glucosyltransferase / alpha-amylase